MHDSDQRARSFMAQQHGLLTRDQAHGLGLTPNAIAHRIERGDWVARSRRVLASTSSPRSTLQEVLVRVLDAGPGAALSHTSALAHWGVRGFDVTPIHVTRHRDRLDHKVADAVLHEVRYLPWDEVRTLEGIPVVLPSVALVQVAGMASIHTGRLARAVDAAWSDRLVTHETLTSAIDRMSRKGRRGLRRIRDLADERGSSYVPPASNLEARFGQLLEHAGLPPMRRQVDCGTDARWVGRVDFRALDCPLIVEVQSERFHRGLLAERDDLERLALLRAAGFTVLEVSEDDLFLRPAVVLDAIRAARARLLRPAA